MVHDILRKMRNEKSQVFDIVNINHLYDIIGELSWLCDSLFKTNLTSFHKN